MADPATRRTIRRSTAVLASLLAVLILLLQGFLAYRGLENDIRAVWPVARYLAVGVLVGGLAYLAGSATLSIVRAET